MTKTDLIAQVAANTEMSKKSAEAAVNAVFDALSKGMAAGEKITISGFGTFEIRERAERQGSTPAPASPSPLLLPAASCSSPASPSRTPCKLYLLCRRCLQEGAAAFFVTGGRTMRLDKYLKVSRLIKRRTVANEVADAGRILINGKVAKASQAVKAGDLIEVTFGNRPIKVRVLSDVEPRTKDVAREMYEILSE